MVGGSYCHFPASNRFACPICGEECPVHDISEHNWRHMEFFQHEAYLHARAPRRPSPEHGVHQMLVPWDREASQFTLLFEVLIMTLVREMPDLTVAHMVGGTDRLLWRMSKHYVSEACTTLDMADVNAVGVDESSSRSEHDYINLFVNLLEMRLLVATPDNDAQTFTQFTGDLGIHGCCADAITQAGMVLFPARQKRAAEHLPNAKVTFDRFYPMKLVNEAVDAMRKGDDLSQPDVKKSHWIWLKNSEKLTGRPKEEYQGLLKNQNLNIAQAYQFHMTFQEICTLLNRHKTAVLLNTWIENIKDSGLTLLVKVAYAFTNYSDSELQWFERQITSSILEDFNKFLQLATAKVRAYHLTQKSLINVNHPILRNLAFPGYPNGPLMGGRICTRHAWHSIF